MSRPMGVHSSFTSTSTSTTIGADGRTITSTTTTTLGPSGTTYLFHLHLRLKRVFILISQILTISKTCICEKIDIREDNPLCSLIT
jgi:hypothetical protein